MNFLEKLAAKAEKAAIHRAHKQGLLRCPACGAKPGPAPVDVEVLLRCTACGREALPAEWQPEAAEPPAADPDKIPPGTRIRRERTLPGECVWHIPAGGKFGYFLMFGLFWMAITVAATGAFLFGEPSDGASAKPWLLYPFLAVFWLVGLGLLHASLRQKYAHHRITVTRDRVTLRREMFGRASEKSLLTPQISAVAQVEFYQQNYQPVHGVEIRGRDGKLRFGSTLRDEEKAWLVADIRRAVFGETRSERGAAKTPEGLASERQSSFSFPLPPGPRGQWVTGALFLCIGLGMVGYAFFWGPGFLRPVMETGHEFATFLRAFFAFFTLVPVLIGLIFGTVGLLMIGHTWRSVSRERRLEGDEAQVALRTYHHGRVIHEQSYPRSSVNGLQATRVGHLNGKPIKRIDLIVDGKATRVGSWVESGAADVWVSDVRRALG